MSFKKVIYRILAVFLVVTSTLFIRNVVVYGESIDDSSAMDADRSEIQSSESEVDIIINKALSKKSTEKKLEEEIDSKLKPLTIDELMTLSGALESKGSLTNEESLVLETSRKLILLKSIWQIIKVIGVATLVLYCLSKIIPTFSWLKILKSVE